ncbi:CHY zinc finger protein [Jatrophihabitans sp. YIM 134969]
MTSAATVPVFGRAVDAQTRCVHWHSDRDVVAIEFACCRRFFPCHACHEETADHPATTWAVAERGHAAVLCGVCRSRLTIEEYLAGGDACPRCAAPFNPGCRLHHHLYFD